MKQKATEEVEEVHENFMTDANENYDPYKLDTLLIASRPGMGKTEAIMQLPNTIIFDLDGSSGYYRGNATIINVKARAKKQGIGLYTSLMRSINDVKTSGRTFDRVVIDTLSVIDELCERLATLKYKKTDEGKDFRGGSVLELAFGKGYLLHRAEFDGLVEEFDSIAKMKVYIMHVKDGSIPKLGDQIAINDVKLTGSLKDIFISRIDAAAIMEIDDKDPNTRVLNFTKTTQNSFIKCRPLHLKDKIIPISQMTDEGIKTNWDKIFLNLNK